MTVSGRSRSRLALLTAASSLVTVGGGLVAAESASAATGTNPDGLTATLSLSAAGGTTDASGNLTVASGGASTVDVIVHYSVTPGSQTWPGNKLASVLLHCYSPVITDINLTPPSTIGGISGTATCVEPADSIRDISLTATDGANPTPVLSVSATATITTVAPGQSVPVTRYDGASRFGTGIAVSQAAFPNAGSANAVVLARGDRFADALAGIPLAKAKNGPLLLTDGGAAATALHTGVEQELRRVLPADQNHTVFILGGTGAISTTVENHISSLGYHVVRLWGASRFDTALAIAEDPRALNNPAHVVVARGDDFADALAAGPLAAGPFQDSHGTPAAILLSTGPSTAASLDSATAAYIAKKAGAPADNGGSEPSALAGRNAVAVGGGAVTAVQALPGAAAGVTSISGSDRYATAKQVATDGWTAAPSMQDLHPLFHAPELGLATGEGFPDALTGGAFMALKNGPLMLTPSASLSVWAGPLLRIPYTGAALPVSAVALFGGTHVIAGSVVSSGVANEVQPYIVAYTEGRSAF